MCLTQVMHGAQQVGWMDKESTELTQPSWACPSGATSPTMRVPRTERD